MCKRKERLGTTDPGLALSCRMIAPLILGQDFGSLVLGRDLSREQQRNAEHEAFPRGTPCLEGPFLLPEHENVHLAHCSFQTLGWDLPFWDISQRLWGSGQQETPQGHSWSRLCHPFPLFWRRTCTPGAGLGRCSPVPAWLLRQLHS